MQQLFGAISEVLAGLEPDKTVREAMVFAAWKRAAGEALRERTVPMAFAAGHLAIGVADETWRHHLKGLSPQMLVKINDLLGTGTVKRIDFRVNAGVANQRNAKQGD